MTNLSGKMKSFLKGTDDAMEVIGNLCHIPITHTPLNLLEWEQEINKRYPQGQNPLSTTLMTFGAFFGQVVVKNIKGAKWNEMENGDVERLALPLKMNSLVEVVYYFHSRELK